MKVLKLLIAVAVLVGVTKASSSPDCPQDNGASPVYYPDEADSQGFWECSNGKAYHLSCPDGLIWNSNNKVCDWPQSKSASKSVAASSPSCPSDNGASPVYYPDESDPQGFWECSNGKAYHLSCPDDLVWNSNSKVCDWPQSKSASKSAAASNPKCPSENGASPVYYPDESDSQGFWECSNGKAYHLSCPDGLVWNSSSKVCDWPKNKK